MGYAPYNSADTVIAEDYDRYFLCRQLAKLRLVAGHSALHMIRYFGQSATIKLTHVFMVAGWWVTVDFDSQYKSVWVNPGPMGYIFMKKQSSKRESA